MQLNPMHLTISGLLAGRLFRIPSYQRAYAWEMQQRSDLFADIQNVKKSERDHFMATVVALARDTQLIGADQFRTVEIVDGQQRITTLVILLKAIEKALSANNKKQARIKREISELLIKDDNYSLVLLQTNHDSSNIFTNYIRSGKIEKAAVVTAADSNIVNAVRECEEFVEDWSGRNTLIDLVATIRNRLSVIYHEIMDEATVYRVFEVLNSRGLDVKWIDKLKSQLMALLFEHVEGRVRNEAVREMQVIWQEIYRILGLRGDLGDEAMRFSGTWERADRQSRIIGEPIAVAELTRAAGTKVRTISLVGSRLKSVVEAVDILDRDRRLSAVTKISHARFVAIAILRREFEPDIQSQLLNRWERVTFRIFGLGGADSRHKVGDYVRLGHQIVSDDMSADEVDKGLVGLGSDYDLDAILAGRGYWSNCYGGWTEELRYLLYRYEEHRATVSGSSLNASQWNKIWMVDPSRTIEHIQPQSSKKGYIHDLGNLTLLPPGINSKLRDKPPRKKTKAYRTSGLLITIDIAELIDDGISWNKKAVRERTTQIEEFVRKEWSG